MRLYLQGLAIGLAYVAPIGMQNLFVINAALSQPRRRSFLIALIVTFFDVSLLLACFFGVGALVERFAWLQMAALGIGGVVVSWIGVSLLRARPSMNHSVDMDIPIPKIAIRAFVVTWLNPQALLDGTLLYGSFRVGHSGTDSTLLVLGSVTASCLWFSGITFLTSCFSTRFNDWVLRIINLVCGSVILLYGLRLVVQLLQKMMW